MIRAAVALLAFACSHAPPSEAGRAPSPSPIPSAATRLLVVTTPDWDATKGELRRYERPPGGSFEERGEAIEIVVGRSGYGWGRGLHGDGAPAGRSGPIKVEGDGRSPAGAFWIRGAYGYDAEPPRGTTLPYAQLGDSWRCVDDPASARYNEVFDAAGTPETWASAEEMRRADELYRWVVIIGHNDPPARPRGGSCIFFHVWGGSDSPTAGCTAMPEPDLAALIPWLSGETALVALPIPEYRELGTAWGLPPLSGN